MSVEFEQKIEAAVEAVFRQRIGGWKSDLARALAEQCSPFLDEAWQQSRQESNEEARYEVASALAACARRFREQDSVPSVALTLVESAAQLCGRAGLFIVKGDRLLGFRAAGKHMGEVNERFCELSIELAAASSMAHVVAEQEPLEATASPANVSEPVAELFGLNQERRVLLAPVALRERVLAVLLTDAEGARVSTRAASLEVLTCLAEASIEAAAARSKMHDAPVAAAV